MLSGRPNFGVSWQFWEESALSHFVLSMRAVMLDRGHIRFKVQVVCVLWQGEERERERQGYAAANAANARARKKHRVLCAQTQKCCVCARVDALPHVRAH